MLHQISAFAIFSNERATAKKDDSKKGFWVWVKGYLISGFITIFVVPLLRVRLVDKLFGL